MRNWILILVGIVVLTVIFIAARSLQDGPRPIDPAINPAADKATPGGAAGAAPRLPSADADRPTTSRADETVMAPQAKQLPQSRYVPRIGEMPQTESPTDVTAKPESVSPEAAGRAAPQISAAGQSAIAPGDPGIPPEGLPGVGQQSQADAVGPGFIIDGSLPTDTSNNGELAGPGAAIDVLGMPATTSPEQAPEASDSGTVGPAPESSDPGVPGPAPEDN